MFRSLNLRIVRPLGITQWYVRFYCGCAGIVARNGGPPYDGWITDPNCPWHTRRALTVIHTDPTATRLFGERLAAIVRGEGI